MLLQETKSVQGFWRDNMWQQYPKHLIEAKPEMELAPIEPLPLRPLLHKKVKMHKHTSVLRSKPKVITRYNDPNPKL